MAILIAGQVRPNALVCALLRLEPDAPGAKGETIAWTSSGVSNVQVSWVRGADRSPGADVVAKIAFMRGT